MNTLWNIEKIIKKGEYDYVIVKEHPKATRHGYVLMHRVIMENSIGRVLKSYEVVHHKDGNKHNNGIKNLELMTISGHSSLHAPKAKWDTLICKNCGKVFRRRHNQRKELKRIKNVFCSRRCNGLYNGFKRV